LEEVPNPIKSQNDPNLMVEYGLHPQTDVPAEIKDAGTREMANYSVSLILHQKLIGSGTLIRVGDQHGILTAAHVARIVEKADQPIGVNIADHPHGFFIPKQCFEHIIVGASESLDDAHGPDLSILRILDLNDLATIKSKKSFYPLDRSNVIRFWESLPINEMLWHLVGAPDERSSSEGVFGTRDHILGVKHFLGEATYKERQIRGKFDFVTLQLIAGQYSFPSDYGGVSGGGIWLLPLTLDPEIGKSTMSYDAPILAGVPFYQRGIINGEREIICHGPESIYIRAATMLRAIPPGFSAPSARLTELGPR
jgi:hypothetical protein